MLARRNKGHIKLFDEFNAVFALENMYLKTKTMSAPAKQIVRLVWNRGAALARIQDASLLRLVCETFAQESPILLEHLREAIRLNNSEDAVIQAHSLKAAAANVGAEECSTLAADMERHAKARNTIKAASILPAFEDAIKRFLGELSAANWD